jgi:molecular chaperone GrpE (heat shock protein)
MTASDPLAITEVPVAVPARLSEPFALLPDVQNLYKRVAKLQALLEEARKQAENSQRQDRFDLLEVADALDRILALAEVYRTGEEASERLYEGVRMTRKMFQQKLGRRGVQRISLIGREADPRLAEVVDYADNTDVPEETVLEEVVVGYRLNEEVLRPAKVVIARHCQDGLDRAQPSEENHAENTRD